MFCIKLQLFCGFMFAIAHSNWIEQLKFFHSFLKMDIVLNDGRISFSKDDALLPRLWVTRKRCKGKCVILLPEQRKDSLSWSDSRCWMKSVNLTIYDINPESILASLRFLDFCNMIRNVLVSLKHQSLVYLTFLNILINVLGCFKALHMWI